MQTGTPLTILIGGPTASGKSAAALSLAGACDGVVINADSMQVYRDLRVLTARPGPQDEVVAPHRLYGHRAPDDPGSVAAWRSEAIREIRMAHADGRIPIVVGGTGLYLKALVEGLSPIPDIPEEARASARERLAAVGAEALHAALAERDPAGAATLRPSDSQRLIRAWEVLTATGRPLSHWQALPKSGPPGGMRFILILLLPGRDTLYATCNTRFDGMLAEGALDEVASLKALGLPSSLPIMRATGVPELSAHLDGAVTLSEARDAAARATRRYAKRQYTWLRHQMPPIADRSEVQGCYAFYEQYSKQLDPEIFSIIRETG